VDLEVLEVLEVLEALEVPLAQPVRGLTHSQWSHKRPMYA